jgi:hypothetical protein
VDYREKIRELDRKQLTKVMGRANLQLVEAGIVKWDDVVTRSRILDFHEVVDRFSLSTKAMSRAGVSPGVIRRAKAMTSTTAHTTTTARQAELVDQLKSKGAKDEEIKRRAKELLGARFGVEPGHGQKQTIIPSGPQTPNRPSGQPKSPAAPGNATVKRPIDRPQIDSNASTGGATSNRSGTNVAGVKSPPTGSPGPATTTTTRPETIPPRLGRPVVVKTGGKIFKEFESSTNGAKWAREQYRPWANRLSDEQSKSFGAFKRSAEPGFNVSLRAETTLTTTQAKTVALLDASIAKARAPQNVAAYRGLDIPPNDPSLTVGSTIADDGFATALLSRRAIENEMGDVGESVVLKMLVERGSRVASLDAVNASNQGELIFPRGTQFRIVSITSPKRKSDRHVITVEIINE